MRGKLAIVMSVAVSLAQIGARAAEPRPNFVPWPKAVQPAPGSLPVTAAARIVTGDPRLAPLALVLAEEIYRSTAVKVAPASGAARAGDIELRLDPALQGEAYALSVGDRAVVRGGNYRAVAWGTVTLLQALQAEDGQAPALPKLTVDDEPAAAYRGLLIDCGRQWHPVETMRPLIEMCRLYKINYLQLHLNDNTEGNVMAFPSQAFPQLATERKGNRTTYTREELVGLVQYADDRGVTLVPELSGPGAHAGPLRSLSPRGNTLDVWNEQTYEKLAILFAEAAEVFKSSPYMHLGGDEGSFGHLGKTPEEQAYMAAKGARNPLNYYLRRMDEIVKKLGKQTICWEGFGGDGGGLPKDIIVMPYESQFNTADKLVKHGFSVINTAWKPLYVVGGRKWEPAYIYDSWNMWLWEHHINTKCHIQLKETDPVLGAQICAWEQPAAVELPSTRHRIPVLSERTWNPKLGKNYADYLPRAIRADALLNNVLALVNVQAGGVTGEERGGYELFDKALTITLRAPPIGTIRYTTDGKEPTSAAPAYTGPFTIGGKDTHFAKLFYNRRVGAYTAEGYVCTLQARIFDDKGVALGDAATSKDYWFNGAELTAHAEGLSGEQEGNVEKFKEALTVTLAASGPGTIRYTLNGKEPTRDDAAYGKPLVLTRQECRTQGILFSRASKRFTKEAPVVILRARLFGADGQALPGLTLERTYWCTGAELPQPAAATDASGRGSGAEQQAPGQGPASVGQWQVYEVSLTAQGAPVSAPLAVTVEVLFTGPSGATRAADAFWDGARTWRARFCPDEVGTWIWQSRCTAGGAGLADVRGRFACVPYTGDNPLYRHGPLRRSADRRRLEWADGTRFFWLADTAWNGVLCAKGPDWERYLETRSRQAFTAIQFVTTQWRAFDKDPDGRTAFVRDPVFRIVPEFFQRLDPRVAAINAHGLVAAPVMIWSCSPSDPGRVLAEQELVLLARYIRARWGAHQVVWILGGDGNYEPEHAKWQRVGRAVFEGRHDRLVTMHMGGQQWTAEYFRGEPWFDFIGYQSGHSDGRKSLNWLVQGPPLKFQDVQPVLPIINMEPNYEMHPAYGAQSRFGAREVRRAAYWSLLLGPPAGITFGVNPTWCWLEAKAPSPGHNLGLVDPWPAGLETPGTEAMTILRRFFDALPWERLRPAQDVLAAQPGAADPAGFVAAAASARDGLIVLYLPVGGSLQLQPDKLAGARSVRWFNPRTGACTAAVALAQPVGALAAPDNEDWLAVLSAGALSLPFPAAAVPGPREPPRDPPPGTDGASARARKAAGS